MLKKILITLDDSNHGFFLEVDLRYPYKIRRKTKHFPFCPENNIVSKDDSNDCMKKIKPKKYTEHKKLICDWTDKTKFLIHYRMLKVYVRHGMVFVDVHEVISFKHNKW